MTWGQGLARRLRAARLNPPTAAELAPLVEASARRGVGKARTRAGRLSVQVRSQAVEVNVTGPIRPAVLAELDADRNKIDRAAHALARERLRRP